MTVDEALTQLLDLPSSFKRSGPNFDLLMHSLLQVIRNYTASLEAMQNQTHIDQAQQAWLDLWGEMFNLPRQINENDTAYLTRIKSTLLSWASTPAGIVKFIDEVYGANVSIIEQTSSASYQIKFTQPFTETQLDNIAKALVYVRPAGIPFLPFQVLSSGPFVTTMGYNGMSYGTGTYLGGSSYGYTSIISDHTNSAIADISFRFLSFPNV